ncbi:MAG: hypothetical protein LBV40_02580 [Methanomicrobiales archaeon]|jgi:uncharacterized UPF0146 family protein|nr:hypothetical protein [Methanomicrobiales archaeon]
MSGFKHIEESISRYIIPHYHRICEIGVGQNFHVAKQIHNAGRKIFCTDIIQFLDETPVPYIVDSVFSPTYSLYKNIDLIYAVRPHEEMIAALTSLARFIDCDLIVYHLGFERFSGAEIIPQAEIPLFFYYKRSILKK